MRWFISFTNIIPERAVLAQKGRQLSSTRSLGEVVPYVFGPPVPRMSSSCMSLTVNQCLTQAPTQRKREVLSKSGRQAIFFQANSKEFESITFANIPLTNVLSVATLSFQGTRKCSLAQQPCGLIKVLSL